eukprot:COSAG06_NODE_4132_length_4539_cov_1.639189_5_plen_179_part_00
MPLFIMFMVLVPSVLMNAMIAIMVRTDDGWMEPTTPNDRASELISQRANKPETFLPSFLPSFVFSFFLLSSLVTFFLLLCCGIHSLLSVCVSLVVVVQSDTFERVQQNKVAAGRFEYAIIILELEDGCPETYEDSHHSHLHVLKPRGKAAAGNEWQGRSRLMFKKVIHSRCNRQSTPH